MRIEKASKIGFCFGVRRAIDILERVAGERGQVETLGAVVHNQQVLESLARAGVRVVDSIERIQSDTVVISAHGATPQVEEALRKRCANVINATCPFVRRAQVAARRLSSAGFSVLIYGDANHREIKGILGWARDKGVATLDKSYITRLSPLPKRLGLLSQTTQVPAHFTEFVKNAIDHAFTKDCELRIIDTICHDTRERQLAATGLSGQVDLMLVIGDPSSANTNRLVELCARFTRTHLVSTAAEIQPAWLGGGVRIGVTAGASTSEETINEVLGKLEGLM